MDTTFPCPLFPADPIDDSPLLLCASSTRDAAQQPTIKGTQKSTFTKDTNSAARLLQFPSRYIRSTEPNETHRQRTTVAMCSDGFVGAELNVQCTKSPIAPRTGDLNRTRRTVPKRAGLFLAHGSLPAPPELCEGVAPMEERYQSSGNWTQSQTSSHIGDTLHLVHCVFLGIKESHKWNA